MTGAAGRDSGDGISGEDAGKEVFRRGLRERILEGGFQERDSGQRGCRQEIPEKKKRRITLRLSRSRQHLSCRTS
jgi:hypothetical protein